MQRRAFLQFLCVGLGVVSAGNSAKALFAAKSLTHPDLDQQPNAQSSVATPEDMDIAKAEDVWYGHWRRVNRRYWRHSRRWHRWHHYYW